MRLRLLHRILALAAIAALGWSPARAAGPASAPVVTPKSAAPRPGTAERAAAPRKLEDIHIEGQLPAPQVLFITARDQRRFVDFQHARYLRSAREIGAGVRMPRRFVVPSRGTLPPAEETR